ncbi:hypothetical protein VNO78_24772 [Psophocarpus tetragonolobus]|uniref:ELF3-like protein 2 n=1 Tax=Psophocarpus tetragonolobus TaxID=3891 RepID=A0AAN9S5V4_PSOTE
MCRRMNRMRRENEEGKEISPMFPRLHVKVAEKGGPKAPPRNKMGLNEFNIPCQNFSLGSTSLFSLPLINYTGPTSSSHINNSQSINFCTSSSPSALAEKSQDYHSIKSNLTKFTQDNFIHSKNSLKALDDEDTFITSGSIYGKNSCFSTIQNNKDDGKLIDSSLSCSFKSLNSFKKKVNSPGVVNLKLTQYEKNQMEGYTEVTQIGQKPEEGHPHSLNGFSDMTNASLISLVKGKNSKPTNKEHRLSKEGSRSVLLDSLKTLQDSNVHTHQEHANFGDKVNSMDHHIEKPTTSDVQKCASELEISRCFLDKGDRNEEEETLTMDISPDNVVGAIGEQQFWKVRRTITNQQKIFTMQVFELHRLIKVQILIARSPHILFEDNLLHNKPPQKISTTEKSLSDFADEKQSSIVKLDSKSMKSTTIEHATNSAVGKIHIPYVNNITKGHSNMFANYGHQLGNLALASVDSNFKQFTNYVYPPPGNQWLIPVMSPSEGLVYKPIIGPCPPNAGFMTPIYGTCGAVSFNPISKDTASNVALAPSSHHKFDILSGSSLPQFLPPSFMHHPSSISASAIEQMGQSNGPENHHSCGEVNSTILYQSSSNMSSPTSQVMSRNISTYHLLKDKELHKSTASSPSKKVNGEVLPLFPLVPTFWKLEDINTQVEQHSQVIKAMPHNPKSASESVARIFRSIQEERKHL